MLSKFIIVFIIIFLYKLISSIIDYINIVRYSKMYTDFISKKSDKIFQYKTICIDLFKKLNISDTFFPIAQKMGYGRFASFKASFFHNFPDDSALFAGEALRIFDDATGICRRKIIECFSPKYWIDFILFLPKNILIYLGISADSIIIKIGQFIYWLISIVITLFSTDIANYIKSFIVR